MQSESSNINSRVVQVISDDEDASQVGKENRAPNKILGKRKFALQDITSDFNVKPVNCQQNLKMCAHEEMIKAQLKREFEEYRVLGGNIDEEMMQIRHKILPWLLEIVFKKDKTLVTLDKAISLIDRYLMICGQNENIQTKYFPMSRDNCQYVILACFDLIQRFFEVTYVNINQVCDWITHQGKSLQQRVLIFEDFQQFIYKVVGMRINCPTSSFYISLSLGIEELDFRSDHKKCLLIEVSQMFVFLLKMSSLSPDLGPSELALISTMAGIVYLNFHGKLKLSEFEKNELPLIQANFCRHFKLFSKIEKQSMKNYVTACISQLVMMKNQGDPHCIVLYLQNYFEKDATQKLIENSNLRSARQTQETIKKVVNYFY